MSNHTPVMCKEVLYFLDVQPGRRYIDATLGGGGHAEAILKNSGEVLGIDQDPEAIKITRRHLSACPGVFKAVHANFSRLAEIASSENYEKVDGILFDLGFASFQVDEPSYGLSFTKRGPLDMRLDPGLAVTAKDLVNALSGKELYKLFSEVGEERFAREIAREIVLERKKRPITTTTELSKIAERVYRRGNGDRHIHPATRIFMALRIAVNSELENLETALRQAEELLKKHGRLVVISFHSGEDRVVKDFMREGERRGVFSLLTRKPVTPSRAETEDNPRARSAKLRAAQKL